MSPSLDSLLSNGELLFNDINYDFSPIVEGSFLYWGASTLYSVPDQLGGLLQDFTGIPNQFALPNDGAEPLSGYTTTVADVLPGLEQGFQYLLNGLAGYFDPSTYGASAVDATTALGDPGALLSDLLPNAGTDLASTLSSDLSTNFSTLLSELATSLIP
jgi:hypothetical protein